MASRTGGSRADSTPRQAFSKNTAAGAGGTGFAIHHADMTPFSPARYKVLVVDDDPSVLTTYRRLLCRAGFTTVTEEDPCRVLANGTGVGDVDLLLLDYRMPGMDGLTLLAELRKKACRARCILVSAYLNDAVRQQAKLLGVDRVLEKPVDVSLLRETLDSLLPDLGSRRTGVGGTASG